MPVAFKRRAYSSRAPTHSLPEKMTRAAYYQTAEIAAALPRSRNSCKGPQNAMAGLKQTAERKESPRPGTGKAEANEL